MQAESEDRSVLVVAFNRRVVGFEARTGQIRWETEIDTVFGPIELAIEPPHVYACDAKHVFCLDYATGRVVGQVRLPAKYVDRPSMVVDGGLIFIAGAGEVMCLDTRGRTVWHDPLEGRGAGRMALGLPGNVRQADDGK